ncbi:NAD(P)H-hydrate dehydratase [Thermodesulforhabdus norvegica]|uniref:NAD(P)H-hydrate repair enzyme Nnr, NAD(P)H-hydrate dehydratase domain n=1 Tax=Thermodesulforhabdus norvegica TaxID=39841 RepID=A0A1I4TS76_9BACT|nr:NAD(P)H-hydrate dehydratase [Thermodesulforhabdus norvegica]SFM79521.1 NAD(P)H-hydrate repair enzyme Nnr, NAD(P)H-hydrate dehydratase domain [Thermodesulforhabdus norvegica]
MLAIVGTVPDESLGITEGRVSLSSGILKIDAVEVEVCRGTPALMAAACVVSEVLGLPKPYALIAGDIGSGSGSRKLYRHLTSALPSLSPGVVVFHYLLPDVDWHTRIAFAIEEIAPRPVLIADAGYMYAAKMSGQASIYDLFTPDAGELAFLADEDAPHPSYTRGFLLQSHLDVPELIYRAYSKGNAAKFLMVKGQPDYIVSNGEIIHKVESPCVEVMEAIGGTGDTLTGIAGALIFAGIHLPTACLLAAKINRLAGFHANLTPASQIRELISAIPASTEALIKELQKNSPTLSAGKKN